MMRLFLKMELSRVRAAMRPVVRLLIRELTLLV